MSGGFLVRDSKHGGTGSPHTLTVLSGARLYNINIRYKNSTEQYSTVQYSVQYSTVQYMLVQYSTVQHQAGARRRRGARQAEARREGQSPFLSEFRCYY